MRRVVCLCLLICGFTAPAANVWGQNLTVQQPVFSNFSVGTTVVAPDRGGTYLGGVNRLSSSQFRPGPFRSGTHAGRETGGARTSAHVWIHDLREMDRALLETAGQTRQLNDPAARLSENAQHAVRALQSRPDRSGAVPVDTPNPPLASRTRTDRLTHLEPSEAARSRRGLSVLADAYRQRAQHLEAQGKLQLARKYRQLAHAAEQSR